LSRSCGDENEKESGFAAQALRELRPAVFLAQEMAPKLGASEVLL